MGTLTRLCAAEGCQRGFVPASYQQVFCCDEHRLKPELCVEMNCKTRISRGCERCKKCANGIKSRDIAYRMRNDSAFRGNFKRRVKQAQNKPSVREKKSRSIKVALSDPATKERMRKGIKRDKNRPEAKQRQSELSKERYLSPEYAERHRIAVINSWKRTERREKAFESWKLRGGKGSTYAWSFRKILSLIHTRANEVCEYCDRTHRWMDVHHIDHDTHNNHPHNLILLCRSCHSHYGNNDAGRYDHPELGDGFETVAHKRSRAMANGWWESVNEVLEEAEKWNREGYGGNSEGRMM